MTKLALALLAILLGLLAPPSPATAGTATWNDGTHDQDTIWNCVTQSPSTGVSANVGWKSPTGELPGADGTGQAAARVPLPARGHGALPRQPGR